MKVRAIKTLTPLILILAFTSGCASFGMKMKNWLGGGKSSAPASASEDLPPHFSDVQNLEAPAGGNYQRSNRRTMEEEARLGADAGSLWINEGQGAYLFAQNTSRLIGDLLNVRIEGTPRSQLETKVKVIKNLLQQLEQQANQRTLAQAPQQQAKQKKEEEAENQEKKAAVAAAPTGEAKKEESELSVNLVPTRIVEKLKDGSYRVAGDQSFMIGKREYKLVVSGIIRADDFDDNGIGADKLLDPKFDIVSSKKTGI